MVFNNRNNFHSLPLTKNVGCLGFLIGAIIISAILFLGFFVGLFILGVFETYFGVNFEYSNDGGRAPCGFFEFLGFCFEHLSNISDFGPPRPKANLTSKAKNAYKPFLIRSSSMNHYLPWIRPVF